MEGFTALLWTKYCFRDFHTLTGIKSRGGNGSISSENPLMSEVQLVSRTEGGVMTETSNLPEEIKSRRRKCSQREREINQEPRSRKKPVWQKVKGRN